jgi:hypothetical protein
LSSIKWEGFGETRSFLVDITDVLVAKRRRWQNDYAQGVGSPVPAVEPLGDHRMERFHHHPQRRWLGATLAGILLVAFGSGAPAQYKHALGEKAPAGRMLAATELPNFWLSAQAPDIEFAWVQVAPEDARRTSLAIDLREIQNLSSGFVTIRAKLGCPGEPPIWTTTIAPHPPTQPGRFLLAIPRDVGPTCDANLTLELDVSKARGAARDRPISVRGGLSYQPVAN